MACSGSAVNSSATMCLHMMLLIRFALLYCVCSLFCKTNAAPQEINRQGSPGSLFLVTLQIWYLSWWRELCAFHNPIFTDGRTVGLVRNTYAIVMAITAGNALAFIYSCCPNKAMAFPASDNNIMVVISLTVNDRKRQVFCTLGIIHRKKEMRAYRTFHGRVALMSILVQSCDTPPQLYPESANPVREYPDIILNAHCCRIAKLEQGLRL